jgi:predicted amino acid dehydrogenase
VAGYKRALNSINSITEQWLDAAGVGFFQSILVPLTANSPVDLSVFKTTKEMSASSHLLSASG